MAHPCNDSAVQRDALPAGFNLSSGSLGVGAADVMFMVPDVKRYTFPRWEATAVSGWLSAWLCFRRHGGGSSTLCGCVKAESLMCTHLSVVVVVVNETHDTYPRFYIHPIII